MEKTKIRNELIEEIIYELADSYPLDDSEYIRVIVDILRAKIIPQAPDAEAAIKAIEEKSKIEPAKDKEDYERFKKQMDEIDCKYGFNA